AHAFDQGQVVFHVADQRPQADFTGLVGQFHAAVLAAHGADPAALGQAVRDLHQVRLGNAVDLGDLGDGAEAVAVAAEIDQQPYRVVAHSGQAHGGPGLGAGGRAPGPAAR